jgi:hypothetical protein
VRIKALALAAALAAGFAATSASAAPVSGSIGVSKSSDGIVLVDHKKGHKNYNKWGKHRHYKPGSHHKHPPKNWRRYDKRPGDWRTRGCVIVGPIWWCP